MIDGERSFVAFTHDPATGARETVVAAVYGIGEGAVAEHADIDHFFVRADGIERLTSHKTRMLRRASGGGVAEYRVPDGLADLPVFSDAQISQIAALAETAARTRVQDRRLVSGDLATRRPLSARALRRSSPQPFDP